MDGWIGVMDGQGIGSKTGGLMGGGRRNMNRGGGGVTRDVIGDVVVFGDV